MTEISLCHACSCHGILRTGTAGGQAPESTTLLQPHDLRGIVGLFGAILNPAHMRRSGSGGGGSHGGGGHGGRYRAPCGGGGGRH
eukprot:COSAG01_NODE_28168_length_667_cov_1.850352_1_plen_84_part_10